MLLQSIYIFIISVGSFLLSAVCGGGAGLLLLPAIAILLPVAQVPAALTLGTSVSSVTKLYTFWQNIQWHVVKWFLPAALPAVYLGALMLKSINPIYVQLIMGVFLISNLPDAFNLRGKSNNALPRSSKITSFPKLIIIGALAGFISGIVGAVGVLFNRFYLKLGLSKQEIVATRAANEVLLHLLKLGLYFSFGLLTSNVLIVGGVVSAGAFIATLCTPKLLARISENLFRRVGYATMTITGMLLCYKASTNIITNKAITLNYAITKDGATAHINWRESAIALEFEYDEAPEYEVVITPSELPAKQLAQYNNIAKTENIIKLEKVYTFSKQSYEVYTLKNGKIAEQSL